ncbi:MAG: hypothetical protein QOD65_4119, partial [Gaiellales bacterium]|nr:hypothetical protein [Gaiellales bacterium]
MTLAFLHFEEPWYIYVSMPLIAAFVGYITKLLAVEMIFRPLEFRGIKPWFGWQGMVPRRAAKMAGIACDSVIGGLLKPEELFDRLDPDELYRQIEEPLRANIAEITEDVMTEFNPGLWEAMPNIARRQLIGRVEKQMPATTHRLIAMLRDNVDQVFDIKHMVVTNLVRDKALLVRMFRDTSTKALKFIVKAGTIFAFYVGLVQVVVFIITGSHLVLPIFGLVVGGLTDWVALRMIFRPIEPGKRILWVFPWQGLFHKLRDEVTEDYAHLLAKDILTPSAIMDSLLNGPMSDKLFEMIEAEVKLAVDQQSGIARPFVAMAIGGRKYQDMKKRIAELVIERMPEQAHHVEAYAFEAMDVDNL